MMRYTVSTHHIGQMADDLAALAHILNGQKIDHPTSLVPIPDGFQANIEIEQFDTVVDRMETLAVHVLAEIRDERDRARGWKDPR